MKGIVQKILKFISKKEDAVIEDEAKKKIGDEDGINPPVTPKRKKEVK